MLVRSSWRTRKQCSNKMVIGHNYPIVRMNSCPRHTIINRSCNNIEFRRVNDPPNQHLICYNVGIDPTIGRILWPTNNGEKCKMRDIIIRVQSLPEPRSGNLIAALLEMRRRRRAKTG